MAIRTCAIALATLLLLNCGGTTAVARAPVPLPAPVPAEASLFSSDAAVLSDQDIDRILSHPYVPPTRARIAILALTQPYWFSWSDELARQSESVRQGVVEQLKTSSAVTHASYLPSFLLPEKRTVGLLREAAARYQADLLLIYRSSCRTYDRYRVVGSDQTKAACSVEVALLDTRTGIVPYTSEASRDVSATRSREDMTFEETSRKAEMTAVADAMKEITARVASFLEKAR